jgi:hypothetical protein
MFWNIGWLVSDVLEYWLLFRPHWTYCIFYSKTARYDVGKSVLTHNKATELLPIFELWLYDTAFFLYSVAAVE